MKVAAFLLLSIFASCFVDVTGKFTWSTCGGSKYIKVENVTISPDAAVPGQPLNAEIQGDVLQEMSGPAKIQVAFPLYSRSINYCAPNEGRPCPVNKGEVKVPVSIPIPAAAGLFAGRSIKGRVKLIDAKGTERVCLSLDVPVSGRRPESVNWIEEIDVLEGLLSNYPYVQLQSPSDALELADYVVNKKHTEDFQAKFMDKVGDILEPIVDPSKILDVFLGF